MTAPLIPLLQRQDINELVVFRALRLGDMLCAAPALRAPAGRKAATVLEQARRMVRAPA